MVDCRRISIGEREPREKKVLHIAITPITESLNVRSSISIIRDGKIRSPLSRGRNPFIGPWLYRSPNQQTRCGNDKNKNDSFIFIGIALETSGEDVFLRRTLALWEPIIQTEPTITVIAVQRSEFLVSFVRFSSFAIAIVIISLQPGASVY